MQPWLFDTLTRLEELMLRLRCPLAQVPLATCGAPQAQSRRGGTGYAWLGGTHAPRVVSGLPPLCQLACLLPLMPSALLPLPPGAPKLGLAR